MANVKITDLTAYTDAASTDVLPVVDVTNDVTKKISIANLLKAAPLGSAAAPGIAFDGDPNTGVYSPGADQVAISTNGSGRLFINANGEIGANTTSSTAYGLRLGPASGQTISLLGLTAGSTSANSRIDFGDSASNDIGRITYEHSSDAMFFNTNGSERLRITSAGLVGIGSSSPAALLEVRSATTNAARLRVTGTGTTAGNFRGYEFGNGSVFKGGLLQDESTDLISIFTPVGGQSVNITSAGSVGIGTTAAPAKLTVSTSSFDPSAGFNNWSDSFFAVSPGGTSTSGGVGIAYDSSANVGSIVAALPSNSWRPLKYVAADHRFEIGGSEKARLTASGQWLVGTSTAVGGYTFQIEQNAGSDPFEGSILLRRGLSNASITNAGFYLGSISAGSQTNVGGLIRFESDAQWGTNDYPTRVVFSTTADGASSPTERMRIASGGDLLLNTTAVLFAQNKPWVSTNFLSNEGIISQGYQAAAGYFNRQGNDGTIINLLQDGIIEGTISVSGTTVSYNGAHLSRWSQLPSGAERIEILRGSVLSNIDEMCEWGEEDNEQLNRMKVSDVEGDKNVSGVFQCWDDDDDTYTNDFYCAMTGDFIIRIAEGVTVERGDLLMSAGDGTAKPQDDDIIRSKTIAKVTSTNVSCTYEDGSYCVPCVLMAC